MTTWRDSLQRVVMRDGRRLIGASFRGVPFCVEEATRAGGRRTVTHEFPGRDQPFVEDLGRRARTFPVEAYIVGDDYVAQRDDLLAALEDAAGPGTLVQPYFGTVVAICTSVTVRESTAEGGLSRLSIEFAEAPAQTPGVDVEIDFESDVVSGADAAQVAAAAEFEAGYDASGMPASAVESAAAEISAISEELGARLAPIAASTQELARLDVRVKALVADAATLVREPGDALAAFKGVLLAVADTAAASPKKVIDALVEAYGTASEILPVATTLTRERERANLIALAAVLRRVLAIEAARLAIQVTFESHEDAIAARDTIADLLDEQAEGATDDAYPALVALRSSLAAAVPGDKLLARIRTIEQPTSIPSLVLAYRLYGDVDSEADVLARNRARHPGFLAGTLSVLTDTDA